jgi:DNA-binding SARP family transcriptional activator
VADNRGAMPDPPGVSVRVLGPAQVTVGGAPAPLELLWRKHLALLVYLARSPRKSRTREHLIGLLWSDRDEKQARHSLSEGLRVLRRVLGEAGVQVDVDQVRLAADGVTLDCDRFAALAARGEWDSAAVLVDGEFLEGLALPGANEFESWLGTERALWRAQALEVFVKSAEAQLARGDTGAAARAALRAVGFDPTSEPAARTAMRALALAGDRAAALRVAQDLARALSDALNAAPSPETAGLVERIREARLGRRVPAAPQAARPRPPLLGRSAELAAVAAAWERAKAGRGQVVLVQGEPGEGKTRVLEELAARARLDDATVAVTRAVPAEREREWSAVAGLLTGGLTDAPGLASAPSAALASLGALDPDLGARFRGGGALPPVPVGDALVAAAIAAAEERPLLLALDDAQWLDPATLATLPTLARDTAHRRVLLLLGVAWGAPESPRFDALRSRLGRDLEGSVIRLGRLDHEALERLVAWAVPAYGADERDRLVRRVEGDTAGIPLLAVALLEAVAAGYQLVPDAPAWPSATRTLIDSLPGDLPPAVVGAVCLRFRGLPAAAQQILGAAAALRGRGNVRQLARATRLEPSAVAQALDVLEWERWLVADARGYVFAAPIEREILLQEMVTPGQARRYRDDSVA